MELCALLSFHFTQVGVWVPLGTGTAVSCVVYLLARHIANRHQISMLDVLLFRRRRHRVLAGVPDEDVPSGVVSPEALKYLKTPEEDIAYLETAPERRKSVRRWGKPVEVKILAPLVTGLLRGVIINRSAGGIAVLVDDEYAEGVNLTVRAVQAPQYVPGVEVEVRTCRKAGKNFVIGCKYSEEAPWNAIAWFG
jgi:hypothetical protein